MLLALLAMVPFFAAGGLRTFIDFDDNVFVTANPAVIGGLTFSSVLWAFTALRIASWHPLTWIAHMTVVSLFGLDPWWHHFVNVLLHAISTALLFTALRRMTGAVWRSALVAALFAVHPLHVESVAWVSELKDVLAGLFFMAGLLAYERYARRGGIGRYLKVVALLALGLLSKPMLVTVPLVLLLCDVWPLGRARLPLSAVPVPAGTRSPGRLLLEKAPLLLLSLASSVATIIAGRSGGAITPFGELPLGIRIANALVAVVGYLGKTFWPRELAIHYPHLGWPPGWQIAGAVILLSGVTVAAARGYKRYPYAIAGWFWFLVMLIPVAGIVQAGGYAMADRYTYLPLIGVFIAVVWGVTDASLRRRMPMVPRSTGAIAVVAALTALSTVQMRLWRDSETLFTHTLAVTRENFLIHNNLGVFYERVGRLDEAEAHYREALRMNHSFVEALSNLGSVLMKKEQEEEALSFFREALRLHPGDASAHYNMAVLLADRGQLAEAVFHYREALRLKVEFAEAHTNLAIILAGMGKTTEAEAHHRESVRLRPDLAEGHRHFGDFLAAAGRFDEAAGEYQVAVRLQPNDAETHFRLGAVRASQGRLEEAAGHFEETLRLDPGHEGVRKALNLIPGLREKFGSAPGVD